MFVASSSDYPQALTFHAKHGSCRYLWCMMCVCVLATGSRHHSTFIGMSNATFRCVHMLPERRVNIEIAFDVSMYRVFWHMFSEVCHSDAFSVPFNLKRPQIDRYIFEIDTMIGGWIAFSLIAVLHSGFSADNAICFRPWLAVNWAHICVRAFWLICCLLLVGFGSEMSFDRIWWQENKTLNVMIKQHKNKSIALLDFLTNNTQSHCECMHHEFGCDCIESQPAKESYGCFIIRLKSVVLIINHSQVQKI